MVDHIGEQFGYYRLIRLLGRGGFAEVYLGKHIHIQTQAAIKVLSTQLVAQDLQRFIREARIIASLEHHHILRVFDFDTQEEIPFLVMDYAQGGTLRQRHPKGSRLCLDDVLSYVQQIAPALQYAHDHHVIHRDVKPENMLLGRQGELLLSDFGITVTTATSTSHQQKTTAGTVAYMAPEQITGEPRLASDQYALGVIVYEWLSGRQPFQGSFWEVCAQHLNAPVPSLRGVHPEITREVEQCIAKALFKDPMERFASVQAFAQALAQAATLESKGPKIEIRANALIEVPQIPIVTVFYSYAHEDELLRNGLEKHLSLLKRQGRVDAWHDRNISAGTEWAQQIDTHLNTASIILLLISPDFISSDYCYSVEMTRALERHNAKEACVIPIILRPVDWQSAPFGKLQALPPEGKPITLWSDRDEAFLEVIKGIRRAIQVYLQKALPDRFSLAELRTDKPQQTSARVWNHPWNSVGAAGPLIGALVAAKQWEQAESEIRAIPDRQSRVRALEIFTTVLIEVQEWGRAEAVAYSVEDSWRKARLLRDLGGKLAQAEEWGRAEAVARSIADGRSRREALLEQGHLLIQAGELARAREVFRAASQIWELPIPLVLPPTTLTSSKQSAPLANQSAERPQSALIPIISPLPYELQDRPSRRRYGGRLALIAFGLLVAIIILIFLAYVFPKLIR